MTNPITASLAHPAAYTVSLTGTHGRKISLIRKVMIPIIMILSAFAFGGCEKESVPPETIVSVTETTAVTNVAKKL